MKKLSVFVFLILTHSSSTWAEKYEFVKVKKDQDPVVLNEGDIAWCVNWSSFSEYIAEYSISNGSIIGIHKPIIGGVGSGSFFQPEQIFIGPCKLGPYWTENGGYRMTSVTFKILRKSESGHKTLTWDGEKYAGNENQILNNNNSPVPNPSNIKYDELLGWVWFTDTPWVYSYTNGTWYYLYSMPDGIYVWNANLPNNGWMKLHG